MLKITESYLSFLETLMKNHWYIDLLKLAGDKLAKRWDLNFVY